MKRGFILAISIFSFMAYFLMPNDVFALEWTNSAPNLVTAQTSDGYSQGSPVSVSAAGYKGWRSHIPYTFGSTSPIPQNMSWQYNNFTCQGQTWTITGQFFGTVTTQFDFFGVVNPSVYVVTDYGQESCSTSISMSNGMQYLEFTCSGKSSRLKQIVLNFTGNLPTDSKYWGYLMLRSDWSDIVCDLDTSDIINNQTNNTQNIINNQNQNTQQIIQGQEDIKDAITDDTPPDTSGLGNSAGWLPAGPLDSILNLPLTMFQNLLNALSNQCTPVVVNLPFVNEPITLPCISVIFSQIEGLTVWWNSIGLLLGGYILLKYLIGLEKWADATLTFRENHWNDWGGV